MNGNSYSYGSLLAEAERLLGSRFEAGQLFTHVTTKRLQHMSFLKDKPAPPREVSWLLKLCERRKNGEPLQYLLGEWEFYGLPFKVGPGVLIPRQDTEVLVEVALDYIADMPMPEIMDLCSGTGCVAIAVSRERSDARVTALERYDAAYGYLIKNIKLNSSRVKPVQGDLNDYRHPVPIDMLVANPPYIPREALPNLQPEVRREPPTALDGGKDGLTYYRDIMRQFGNQVKQGGVICVEVGIGQSEQVKRIMEDNGMGQIRIRQDYSKVPRVVSGILVDGGWRVEDAKNGRR